MVCVRATTESPDSGIQFEMSLEALILKATMKSLNHTNFKRILYLPDTNVVSIPTSFLDTVLK